MKRILTMLTAALLLASTVSVAQERGGNQNDLTFAVTAGYNGSVMQSAQPGNQPSYSVSSISTNWNDKSLGLGVELGWFFVDLWRLNVGGGFSFTNTPGYPAVPGTVDQKWEAGDGSIPDYLGVANQNTMQFNVSLGFDRYFRTEVEGLLPFVGIKAGYAYGSNGRRDMDGPVRRGGLQHPRRCDRGCGLLPLGRLLRGSVHRPLRLHLQLHDDQASGRTRRTGCRQPQLQRLRGTDHQNRFLLLSSTELA